jgi:hypothetical protein
MNPNARTEAPSPTHTVTWPCAAAFWVALIAATLTACGGGRTHTTAAATSGASPADPTGPATATASPVACKAPAHPTHASHEARTHTSGLLRYQMDYPAGWRLTRACSQWRFGHDGDEAGDGTTDVYRSPRESFVVSSQAIPAGMTLAEWLPTYAGGKGSNPTCWPPPTSWPTTRIAGHPARLHGEDLYCNFTEAVTVVGDRAYVFTGMAGKKCCHVFDMARFTAFLASVTFPADAG